ncbi:hypothetical protein FOZ60_012190 [Perkinsus olseni]|uniref:Uncharacterized protein n=1 Tax=Perkinsus olseni TaxID=32597 RepID=A0A7J6PA20_PEROL|nr:hypothetical protein FOZ60_012190 [Perkinsus olseni]
MEHPPRQTRFQGSCSLPTRMSSSEQRRILSDPLLKFEHDFSSSLFSSPSAQVSRQLLHRQYRSSLADDTRVAVDVYSLDAQAQPCLLTIHGFYQAIARGDRVDSSLKDVAGLLNMVGHVHAAVRFLEDHRGLASNVIGYENLLERLKVVVDTLHQPDEAPAQMEADRADVLAASAKFFLGHSLHLREALPQPSQDTGHNLPQRIKNGLSGRLRHELCCKEGLNVPKLVDHYVIEWATDVWQELCKRLAVRLHLDKEHHKPLPMSTDEGNGEDLQELSSRTRHNYMAAFKNLFETPTFQRGDSLIEEVLDTLTVVATRLPQIYEEVSNLRRVDPAEDPAGYLHDDA